MSHGHVLVVEDDEAIRQLLVEYLKAQSGLHVDSARDGVDALHQVSMQSYDLVILDVMMPYMTGVDFLDSLQVLTSDRSVQTLRELPAVIVVTSASQEQIPNGQIEERFPAMVRAVLRKPLRTEELRHHLSRLLS